MELLHQWPGVFSRGTVDLSAVLRMTLVWNGELDEERRNST